MPGKVPKQSRRNHNRTPYNRPNISVRNMNWTTLLKQLNALQRTQELKNIRHKELSNSLGKNMSTLSKITAPTLNQLEKMKNIVTETKRMNTNTKIHQNKINLIMREMKRRNEVLNRGSENRPRPRPRPRLRPRPRPRPNLNRTRLNSGNNLSNGEEVNVGGADWVPGNGLTPGKWVTNNMQQLKFGGLGMLREFA